MSSEIIEAKEETNTLPVIADDTLVALADAAEKRVEAMNRIKKMALKLTNPYDWVDENGKPYLQTSGAEKVARLFGISWRISEPTKENLEGGHFSYTYRGEFSLAGATIDAIGTRSSKDGFFKKYTWEGPEGNKKRIELPASEIDVGDVKKSAYTNLLGNGITRLLGIRNLTYEDLKEYAGVTKEMVAPVEYKKGGKAQPKPVQSLLSSEQTVTNSKQSPNSNAPASNLVTEAQIRAIYSLLDKISIKDEMDRHIKVSEILGFSETIPSMGKLTAIQASTVIMSLQSEIKNGSET